MGDPFRLISEPRSRAESWGKELLDGKKGVICGKPVEGSHNFRVALLEFGADRGWATAGQMRPASPLTIDQEAKVELGCTECGGKTFVTCIGCGKALCELHEDSVMESGHGDYCPACTEFICGACCVALNTYAGRTASTWLNDPEEEQEEEGKQLEDEDDDANERERTKQGTKDDANKNADVVCGNCARIGWPEVCSLACVKATQEDGDCSKLQQLSTAPKEGWGEELEATVDAFLAFQESASQDRLTDLLAQKLTFATNSDETAQALEMFLLTEVLPANKIVRISGLSGRTELNGRIGILLLNLDARPGRAPISLVPTEAAPREWVHAKLTHLRPAPMEEFKAAVAASIQIGKLDRFQDLLIPPEAS